MALSANLQAAFDAGEKPLWLFEAQLPDATRYWGHASVGSTGHFEGKVVSWGTLDEQISDERSGALFNASFSLTIADTDKDFSNLTESSDAFSIKDTTGILYLAAPGVAFADWSERFRGRLTSWELGDGRVTLQYRERSLPLLKEVPDNGWTIGAWNFPYAASDVRTQIAPLIYGRFDSSPYTNQGFVPALLVDTTGDKRHLVCAGYADDVPRVWKNETLQTVTTHYTIQRREIAGRLYTLIEWESAASVADDDVITCDVDGYEATGDGSGALITEPAAQLKHFLINFVFGQYKKGNWATSHNQVDATSFTAASTFFSARNYSSARRISEAVEAQQLVAEWARCHEARVWWGFPGAGDAGKIHVGVEDPTVTDLYSATWQPAYLIDAEPLRIADDDRLEVDGLRVQSVFDPAQDQYIQNYSVTRLSQSEPVEESFDIRWGPAS